MYGYEWTEEYGIFRLTINAKLQKEIRPVFHEELDFFGMDAYWDYPKDTTAPLLWAEGIRRYVMNGVCVAEAQGGGFYTKPTISLLTKERLQLKPINVEHLYKVNHSLMVGLEQKAIGFIQEQYAKYVQQGFSFICAFSGGKDSLVLLDLVAKALAPTDYYVVFSNTGMELSTTLETIEIAKKHWFQLRFEEAKSSMNPSESWEEIGPPASRLRWCCSVHKSVPTILLIQKLTGNNGKAVVFDGVRAEESLRRSKYEEVGEGVKNALQINCHAILKWCSAEVFIYLLAHDILLNNAYRLGLYRIGCKVCPMSAKWQDSLIAHQFPNEIEAPLKLLEKITIHTKGNLDKRYIEDGGWQARVGGRILMQGENRVSENIVNDRLVFTLTNTKQNWKDVSPIFGNPVESNPKEMLIKSKTGLFTVHIETDTRAQTISIYPYTRLDRFAISALRGIANKTAYCVGCMACMPQCPTGAFLIDNRRITIRNNVCVHCYNCCTYTDKGCMVAKSLFVRSDRMENPDKYRNFGFRQAFYAHYLEYGDNCPETCILGKDQYTSLKQWLADAGLLKAKKVTKGNKVTTVVSWESTLLSEKLYRFGPFNPFPWAVIWANLAYNSLAVRTFCFNIASGEIFDKDFLSDCFNNDIGKKYRDQATNSLLSTFRDSPIGSGLKQGLQIDKSYLREGWDYPHAVALLYALYLYAEHTGRRTFSFTELINAHSNMDAQGISPHDIFGIDAKAFREQVQGLAINYPEYIRVSFVANLDNIILDDHTSNDIIDLAGDD